MSNNRRASRCKFGCVIRGRPSRHEVGRRLTGNRTALLVIFDTRYRPRYHRVVSNAVKILERMRNNPLDLRIEDLKVVAKKHGIKFRQHGTSHVGFRHSVAGSLAVPAARPIKPVYVRQFVMFVDRVEGLE